MKPAPKKGLFIRLPLPLLVWLRLRAAKGRRKIGAEVELIFEDARDREKHDRAD